MQSRVRICEQLGKAVEGYRTTRRFAMFEGAKPLRQVLDCASPLAL
jgi:hypothetical protein